jgi:hypothetical protein
MAGYAYLLIILYAQMEQGQLRLNNNHTNLIEVNQSIWLAV